jgi:hypothetical protein
MVEVRLLLTPKSATLVVVKGGKEVLDQEVWTFDSPAPHRELRDLADCVFHDCYDLINQAAHGSQ